MHVHNSAPLERLRSVVTSPFGDRYQVLPSLGGVANTQWTQRFLRGQPVRSIARSASDRPLWTDVCRRSWSCRGERRSCTGRWPRWPPGRCCCTAPRALAGPPCWPSWPPEWPSPAGSCAPRPARPTPRCRSPPWPTCSTSCRRSRGGCWPNRSGPRCARRCAGTTPAIRTGSRCGWDSWPCCGFWPRTARCCCCSTTCSGSIRTASTCSPSPPAGPGRRPASPRPSWSSPVRRRRPPGSTRPRCWRCRR